MLSPDILVGVQYDFVDLGDEEFSERIVNSATGLDAGVGRLNVDSGNEVHLVTARLSLKFNREAAARSPEIRPHPDSVGRQDRSASCGLRHCLLRSPEPLPLVPAPP